MSIRAVIFDMDGVLIDAKEWHYEALNRALALFGFAISRQDHETRFDGLPTSVKLKHISAETCLPDALHSFINRMKQRYTRDLADELLRPRLHHVDALLRLRAAGYRVGVASNSIRETVAFMMERAGLTPFLDFFLGNQDVARPKPAPDIYLRAAAMAGVAPATCLVIEDNSFGVQAATAAGMHVLAVRHVDDVTFDAIQAAISRIESTADRRSSHAA